MRTPQVRGGLLKTSATCDGPIFPDLARCNLAGSAWFWDPVHGGAPLPPSADVSSACDLQLLAF